MWWVSLCANLASLSLLFFVYDELFLYTDRSHVAMDTLAVVLMLGGLASMVGLPGVLRSAWVGLEQYMTVLWRRRLLVEGRLVFARVSAVKGGVVELEYEACAKRMSGRSRAYVRRGKVPWVGDRVPLLVDRADPSSFVAPTLLDVSFDGEVVVRDARVEVEEATRRVCVRVEEAFEHRLTLRCRRGVMGVVDRLMDMLHRATLSLRGGVLVMHQGVTRADVEVILDGAIAVHCVAWPVPGDRVEVGVTIRQRGAAPSAPSIRFGATLPAVKVSAAVPLGQHRFPVLDPEAFEAVWSVVEAHALSSGEEVGALLRHRRSALEPRLDLGVEVEALEDVSGP